MLTWFKRWLQGFKESPVTTIFHSDRDNDFNRAVQKLEECAYFVRGYKCSLDCEKCPFALDDGSGEMDTFKAKGLCEHYKTYYRPLVEMNDEQAKWYESLTDRQRSTYESIRMKALG